jgi:hypothetical protein
MKQQWLKAAAAAIAVVLASAPTTQAQNYGGAYNNRTGGYPASQQYYNPGQGYNSGPQYGGSYGPGYYNQGQGYYQGGQGQGWNQPGWNQPGWNQQGWNQPGQWGGGNYGNAGPYYHYSRGYQDGFNHGHFHGMQANSGQGGQQQDEFQFARIRGELQQVKQVQIPGLEEPLMVGTLMSDRGHRMLVAFGPAKGLEELKLQSGQHVTVTGEICRTCNRALMLAEQVRAQGKSVPIQAFQNIEPRREQLRGKLTKIHNVQLPGMRDAMVVGLVKTKQNQDAIVNLGSTDLRGELEADEGAQVQVDGIGFEINGKQVLFADRIRVNGETFILHHDGGRSW